MTTNPDFEINRNDFFVQLPQENPRAQSLLHELAEILRKEWAYHSREDINRLYYLDSDGSGTEIGVEWNLKEGQPHAIIGSQGEVLLNYGWIITGFKSNRVFLGKLENAEENEYTLSGLTDELSRTYDPSPCEVCGEKEATKFAEIKADISEEELSRRIENNEYIPRYWVYYLRICNDCEVPEEYDLYENEDGEPDFTPSNYPDYTPYETEENN